VTNRVDRTSEVKPCSINLISYKIKPTPQYLDKQQTTKFMYPEAKKKNTK